MPESDVGAGHSFGIVAALSAGGCNGLWSRFVGNRYPTEEAARQEWNRFRLYQIFFKFRDPILCNLQAQILNQNGLHEMICSVRLLRRGLPDQRLGFGVLVRTIGLFEPFEQYRNEGGFMRGHGQAPICWTVAWVAGSLDTRGFGAAIVNVGPSVVRPSLFRRERDRQHLKADDMPPDHAEDW